MEKAQLLLGVISPKEPATIGMIPKLAVGHMIKKTAAPQRLATEMTLARLRSLCTIFFASQISGSTPAQRVSFPSWRFGPPARNQEGIRPKSAL